MVAAAKPRQAASRGRWVFAGCGCLRVLREPEVRGRASDGATAAADVVFEREAPIAFADDSWSTKEDEESTIYVKVAV